MNMYLKTIDYLCKITNLSASISVIDQVKFSFFCIDEESSICSLASDVKLPSATRTKIKIYQHSC